MTNNTGKSIGYNYDNPRWQRVRKERLAYDNWTCQTCGESNMLQVHHLPGAYGKESLSNTITLCIWCHEAITDSIRARREGANIDPEPVHTLIRSVNNDLADKKVSLDELTARIADAQRSNRKPARESSKGYESYIEQTQQDRRGP